MSDLEEALLHWLAKCTNQEQLTLETISNPTVFFTLANSISLFPSTDHVGESENSSAWQTYYINYKNIYHSVDQFYKNVLKSHLPLGLPSINLLDIAKGQDKEGLVGLLTIFFIACINSNSKDKFIASIMELSETSQMELMTLIQEKNLTPLESMEELSKPEKEVNERSKMDELYFKIQSLGSENESLTVELMAEAEEKQKLKEHIKKIETDNKKLKRDLDERNLYIQQKEQQDEYEESSNKVMTDSNEEVIRELKREIVEQEKKHLEEKLQFKEEIETIKYQLVASRDKVSELEGESLMGVTNNRKINHQDCVSINEHKNVTQKLQLKIKALEQKETELERDVLRAKYEYDELTRKCKKEEKEKENMKMEYEKINQNKSKMIEQKSGDQLKMEILQAVRDKLKSRLAYENKKKPEQQKVLS